MQYWFEKEHLFFANSFPAIKYLKNFLIFFLNENLLLDFLNEKKGNFAFIYIYYLNELPSNNSKLSRIRKHRYYLSFDYIKIRQFPSNIKKI